MKAGNGRKGLGVGGLFCMIFPVELWLFGSGSRR
jgi:hypothetical protein